MGCLFLGWVVCLFGFELGVGGFGCWVRFGLIFGLWVGDCCGVVWVVFVGFS